MRVQMYHKTNAVEVDEDQVKSMEAKDYVKVFVPPVVKKAVEAAVEKKKGAK